ncbi:hypothetical protein WR164_02800 [Philodulcilactobacillus myokoensis]|uniref:HTH LytTR-type domain-containing protein n=1 Tax=Philodulcilactobacillus myokoensis TaxID=2929573 RepID=A0A9W6B013_9LACO|nr:hypothetical protein WR164_02800 [Philodulcilactobacillus myokoensis]
MKEVVNIKVNLFIDGKQSAEHADLYLKQMTDRYHKLIGELQNSDANLWGYHQDQIVPLDLKSVSKFYSSGQNIWVKMNQHDYEVKKRLYQLVKILPENFIQISRSEIVNFDLVDHLELTNTGMIKLIFKNHDFSYVSRRYVPKIKRRLGI